MTEMSKELREDERIDGQGFDSTHVWDYQNKRVVDNIGTVGVEFQRRRLRTFDVGVGLVDVGEAQPGPQ